MRLLCLTLQLLAALTLPHMILDAWLDRRDGLAGQGRTGAFPTVDRLPPAAPR